MFTVSERRQLQKRLGWIPTCDAPKIGAPEFWYSELPTFDCSVHEQRYLCSMILRVVYNEGKKTPESAYYTAASSTSLEVDFFPIPVTWGSGGIPKDEVKESARSHYSDLLRSTQLVGTAGSQF